MTTTAPADSRLDIPVGRRARKRAETRQRLVEAAREAIGARGVTDLTIAEVTERADVGFGTFYGYFDSKEALLEALVLDALERIGQANDALTADLDDPAEIMAVAIRQTMGTITIDPTFAAFVVQVGFSGRMELWGALHSRMAIDVRRGQSSGRFDARRGSLSVHLLGGALLAAMRAAIAGEPDVSPEAVAEASLLLLGVSTTEARDIAGRPFPQPASAEPGAELEPGGESVAAKVRESS